VALRKALLGVFLLAATNALAQNPVQIWKQIEADNGAIYAIDLNSISHNSNGPGAFAIICIMERNACPLMNMTRVVFDCQGKYTDVDHGNAIRLAPPRSVAGRLANIACSRSNKPNDARAPDNPSPSVKGDATTFYQSRYFLAGFLLRAGRVCETNTEQMINAAVGLLATPELKTISKAYPQNVKKWMEAGADSFNTGTMQNGVTSACTYAVKIRGKAEDIAKADQAEK
jgi:hypothetical protein